MSQPALTDLEARLAAPDGPAVRDALQARASALESRLRAAIAAGLPRHEFPAWQAAADAAAAARQVLASPPPAQGGTTRSASPFAPAFPSISPR